MTDITVFERPMPVTSAKTTRELGFQSAVKHVCTTNSWLIGKRPGDADKRVSHLSYLGGKLAVPMEHNRLFLKAYLTDFLNGWFGAYTENPGEGCMPMYFDYDLWSKTFPTEAFWTRMETLEKMELRRFFPTLTKDDPAFQSTITTSGVIDVDNADGSRWFKCGIHVYYPKLYVTVDMALYICTAVLAAAEKEWPSSDMMWDKQIDRAVYGPTRGLRMVYMFKAKPCPKCCVPSSGPTRAPAVSAMTEKMVFRDRCDVCEGAKKVPDTSASMYAPLYRVDGNLRRTAITPACRSNPTLELMLECSLRSVYSPDPTDGFYIYSGAIPIPVLRAATTKSLGAITCSGEAQMASSLKKAQEVITRDNARWGLLLTAIRRLDPMYEAVDIKSAFKQKGRGSVTYKVRSFVFHRGG